MRERLLISGDSGVGKTAQCFSLIEEILYESEQNIYFLDCDSGAERFLRRVEDFKDSRFFYYDASDWIHTRDSYRDVRKQWKAGDWIFVDRVDMIWEYVQNYYNAAVQGIPEEDLDDLYMSNRIAKRAEESVHKDTGPEREIGGTDWQPIKDNYNSVVYNAFSGTESRRLGINVVMTTLAVNREGIYRPKDAKKPDARDLFIYGVVVQGEKNLPSLPDTHLLLRKGSLGYIVDTVKDREREGILREQAVDNKAECLHKVYRRVMKTGFEI